MTRSLTVSLAALLAATAPAFAGGIGCDVTVDKTTYTQDKAGLVAMVVELERPEFDCSPAAFIESDSKRMGPVLQLERQVDKGKWAAVEGWQTPKSYGPQKTKGTPFRIDWGCSMKIRRKAKLPPGIYRIRVVATTSRVPGHRFQFTSKTFTVFAKCKTATKP